MARRLVMLKVENMNDMKRKMEKSYFPV